MIKAAILKGPTAARFPLCSSSRMRLFLAVIIISFIAGMVSPKTVNAACSSYRGRAVINEVHRQGNAERFVEIKLLDASIGNGIYNNWTVTICSNTKGCTSAIPLPTTATSPYIVVDLYPNINKDYIDLTTDGMDVILKDASGTTIDYLSVAGYMDHQDATCTPAFGWTVAGSNTQTVDRDPDGTGNWSVTGPGGSNPPTKGASNDGINGCTLANFAVSADTTALACPDTRAQVTITAKCANGSTKTDYIGTVNLTDSPASGVFYSAASGGIPITSTTFALADNGVKTVYFYFPNENHATEVRATDSLSAATGFATIDFRAYGFDVSTIATQTSCKESPQYQLTAYGKLPGNPGCNIITGFSGNKGLKAWFDYVDPATNPAANRVRLTTSGGAVTLPTAQPSSANATANFTNGQAAFTFNYADAGAIRLNFRHDDAPYSGVPYQALLASSNIVVAPAGLCVFSDDLNSDCASGDSTCTALVQAGQTFNLKIRAVCWESAMDTDFCTGNSTTPNFQLTDIAISHNLIAPTLGGNLGTIGTNIFDMTAGDNGVHTISNQTVSEVGVFTFTANPPAYLSAGDVIPTSTSANIGRFIPARFAVTPGNVTEACDPGNFTYLGQDGFSTSFTLTAQNTAGATTQNYTGGFAKLGLNDWNNFAFTAAGLPAGSTMSQSATPPSGNWANGFATVTARHQVSRPATPIAPADIMISTKPVDSDGVTTPSAAAVQTATTPLRWGRLKLTNAFGPETSALAVPIALEYFDGTSFVTNTLDVCTSINTGPATPPNWGMINLSNYTNELNQGETEPSFLAGFVSGQGSIILSSPGTSNYGSVNLAIDLANKPWLRFDWDNNGFHDNDPSSQAFFGIYRGNDRIINWREITR